MNDIDSKILSLLPYRPPFRFVDQIIKVDPEGITGLYTLKEDEYFYSGHFPEKKVTPGVILIEIMAQIGLVCHGIYLQSLKDELPSGILPAFSSTQVDFLAPVYPPAQLEVSASKIYYRFNKLKSKITCKNVKSGEVVSRGEFSGMIIKNTNG